MRSIGARLRATAAVTVTLALLGAAAATNAGAQAPQDLIVQSTTSVRDSGLLDQLITPGFKRAYPRYNLRFVAVGTGQAIANARAGQSDALIAHSPPLEEQFVKDGFSYERAGRSMAWNDYVIVGPTADPAGVSTRARNDAASALEAIAAAGAQGRASFVSRGDNSGTNTKEREIWGLTSVARNARNEPAQGAGYPSWYPRAGLGMAATLRLTQECPFPGRGCYTITDRGTLQQLVGNGAITGLKVVMDAQRPAARGGEVLMVNAYRVYALNPAKVPAVKLEAARAFLDFVTSARFQRQLASFPNRTRPGFFPAAFPRVSLARRLPRVISAARPLRLGGRIASAVPGDTALSRVAVRLVRFPTPLNPVALDRDLTSASGRFSLTGRAPRSGELFLTAPRKGDLSPLVYSLGRVRVRADATLASVRVRGRQVVLRGRAWPAEARRRAMLHVRARRAGSSSFGVVRRVRLRGERSRYRVTVTLPSGSWSLQTRYLDRGAVAAGTSNSRTVTVGG